VASGSCRGLVYGRWSVVGGRSSASGSGIARLPGLALSTLASPIFTKSPSPIHETEASYQTPTSLLSSPSHPLLLSESLQILFIQSSLTQPPPRKHQLIPFFFFEVDCHQFNFLTHVPSPKPPRCSSNRLLLSRCWPLSRLRPRPPTLPLTQALLLPPSDVRFPSLLEVQ
jgi:hypothetical protein